MISCQKENQQRSIRPWKDSVGFASTTGQMNHLFELYWNEIELIKDTAKVLICPHDDYAYVQKMYPKVLSSVKAKKLILFGVAHQAKRFGLKDKLVFGKYNQWASAYGNINVWNLQEIILKGMSPEHYVVHDSLMAVEHSLEPFLPILQKMNGKDMEILPVLVPYASFNKLKELTNEFSKEISNYMLREGLEWGKDVAIIISNDAVHYGCEAWGTSDFAFMGCDSAAYIQAVDYEHRLIETTLTGQVSVEKIEQFYKSTVDEQDYTSYKWTWCGRFSVPAGLLTALVLEKSLGHKLKTIYSDYSTSISKPAYSLEQINMGTTAPANIHHWVGYAGIIYN